VIGELALARPADGAACKTIANGRANIESIARGVDSGKPKFWLGLASDYVDECLGG
jgi:hypothetical protein